MTNDLQAPPVPPIVSNHPPRLDERSIAPHNFVCQQPKPTSSGKCPITTYDLGKVIDEDTADTLKVRWFLDFDTSNSTGFIFEAQIFAPANDLGERDAHDASLTTFDPNTIPAGSHVIKVLVSDGFAFDITHDQEKVRDDKGVASYSWCVDTTICKSGSSQ